MAHILFRCPHTGLNVQHWLDEAVDPARDEKSYYEAVICPACTRMHLVNRSTGKTLGENKAKDVKPTVKG
jgi:hypothetical protein